MNKLVIFACLWLVLVFRAAAAAPEIKLPFTDNDARYFFVHEDKLYLGEHTTRTLYRVNADYICVKVEDLAGWYILDAAPFNGKIVYCSRQRLLYKEQGKVVNTPVAGTVQLISATTDGKQLFLLDKREDERKFAVVFLDAAFRKQREFMYPGRYPLDIYYHEGFLWVYDQQDKCVHKLNLKTGEEILRIHTGVGHSWSEGIVFYNGVLYAHDRAKSALVPVLWKEEGSAAFSCLREAEYTFRLESRNISPTGTCKAEFRVPVPADVPGIKFSALRFQPEPGLIKADVFGQQLAYFTNIRIPPNGAHTLVYTARVQSASVQYTLPEVPLKSLASIPDEIKTLYLRSDSYIPLTDPGLMKAGGEAAPGADGKAPAGVKALIINLVTYIIDRLEYDMDDSWDGADQVLPRGTGSCSEYSFLFSALARLNGIPTRLAGGFQLDGNFHRWTEVWYPGTGWVPVDAAKIDSGDIESRDYEYLFGKTYNEIPVSHIGTCADSELGENYYIYRYYTGGKRERMVSVKMGSIAMPGVSGVVEIKRP